MGSPAYKSPTELLRLPDETQAVLDQLATLAKMNIPLNDIRELISPAIRKIRDDFSYLGSRGEQSLEGCVENAFLTPARNPFMTGLRGFLHNDAGKLQNDKAARTYHAFYRCKDGSIIDAKPLRLRNEDVRTYRDLDIRFEQKPYDCERCNQEHKPIRTFMLYDLGLYSEYRKLWEQRTKLDELYDHTPARQKVRRSQLEKQRQTLDAKLDAFASDYDLLAVITRIKGDTFPLKITDMIFQEQIDEAVRQAEKKKKFKDEWKIKSSKHPNAIKDYLALKGIVTGENGKNRIVNHLYNLALGGLPGFSILEVEDYWGPQRFEDDGMGRKVKVGRKEDSNGNVTFEAWKADVIYAGMPIEIQIQTEQMLVLDRQTHPFHHEKLIMRRKVAERAGVPHTEMAQLIRELTG